MPATIGSWRSNGARRCGRGTSGVRPKSYRYSWSDVGRGILPPAGLDKLSTSLGWGFSRASMAVDLRKLALGEPGESTGKHGLIRDLRHGLPRTVSLCSRSKMARWGETLNTALARNARVMLARSCPGAISCSIANAPRTAHGDRSSGPVSLVRQKRAGPAGWVRRSRQGMEASDSGRVVFPKRYCFVTTILLGVGPHHATRNPLDPSVGQRPRKPAPGWARPFSPRAFWPQLSWRVSPQPSQPPPSSL